MAVHDRSVGHEERPYGSWPSALTADDLASGAASVSEVRVDGADVWWNEARPAEGGRTQLVRRTLGGTRHDLFPLLGASAPPWNARSGFLAYGGGAWNVRGGVVVFVNWEDQQLYRVDATEPERFDPQPLTPGEPRDWRWCEPIWLDDGWLVVLREDHRAETIAHHGEAVDEIVAVPLDGSGLADPSRVRVLVSGPDFLHSPAVRGDLMAWVQWEHPDMPWDATEVHVGRIRRDAGGEPLGLEVDVAVAGGADESIVQPGFTSTGDLVFCTDRTGWWNPWIVDERGLVDRLSGATPVSDPRPLLVQGGIDAEIGGPLWVGGLRWWAEVGPGRFAVSARRDGSDRLGVIVDGVLVEVETPFSEISQIVAAEGATAIVAASPLAEPTPYLLGVESPEFDDGAGVVSDGDPGGPIAGFEQLRPRSRSAPPASSISVPKHVTFTSAGGREAHALVYPPTNPDVRAPAGERPPLLVMIHGGPTSHARHRLDLGHQYWTSRGFVVADVDHGGSTGYGRPFRRLLDGAWGLVDVEDAVAAARHLADTGVVDRARLAIRGGSAGGFTTLAALCFHGTFAAGTSRYGVVDLAALARDTHKFESRYLDRLVGPLPAAQATYDARSPIHHTAGFDRPLLVEQGSEDEVVPPNQAEAIVDALAAAGVPHAYLLFEGEGHGFRRRETIVRALEAELWFYGRVFGFAPADPIEPVAGAVGL